MDSVSIIGREALSTSIGPLNLCRDGYIHSAGVCRSNSPDAGCGVYRKAVDGVFPKLTAETLVKLVHVIFTESPAPQ